MTWFSQISWDETYGIKVSPSNSKDTLGIVHHLQFSLGNIHRCSFYLPTRHECTVILRTHETTFQRTFPPGTYFNDPLSAAHLIPICLLSLSQLCPLFDLFIFPLLNSTLPRTIPFLFFFFYIYMRVQKIWYILSL